jgi:hypothetical protein
MGATVSVVVSAAPAWPAAIAPDKVVERMISIAVRKCMKDMPYTYLGYVAYCK